MACPKKKEIFIVAVLDLFGVDMFVDITCLYIDGKVLFSVSKSRKLLQFFFFFFLGCSELICTVCCMTDFSILAQRKATLLSSSNATHW